MLRRILSIAILLFWCGLIFSFSNDTGEESGGLTEDLIIKVVSLLTNIEDDTVEMENIVSKLSFPVRKFAHFTEYFILAIITFNACVSFNINRRVVLIVSIFCILYAIFDEVHQLFIDGRSGNLKDVLLDSSGSLIGTYIVNKIYYRRVYEKTNN